MQRMYKSKYLGFLSSISFARAISTVLSVITLPFLILKLGIEGFGQWSYILALMGFFNVIADPGIATFAEPKIAKKRNLFMDKFKYFLTLRILFGFLAVFALVLYTKLFENNEEISNLLIIFGFFHLLGLVFSSDYILRAKELFHQTSIQMLLAQFLYATGVFVLIRKPEDISYMVFIMIVSSLVSNIYGWSKLLKDGFKIGFKINLRMFKVIIKGSSFYALSSIMSQSYTRLGHILVRHFLGEYALGVYSAIIRFIEIIFSFVSITMSLLMPRIAFLSSNKKQVEKLINFSIILICFAALPSFFGIILTSESGLKIIFDEEFSEFIHIFQIAAFYILTNSFSSFFSGTVVYGLGMHQTYLRSTIYGAILGILMYLLLIPMLGILGSVVAFFSAQIAVGLTALFQLKNNFKISPNFELLAMILKACMLFYILIFSFRFFEIDLNFFIQVLLGLIIYFLYLFFGNFFKKFFNLIK